MACPRGEFIDVFGDGPTVDAHDDVSRLRRGKSFTNRGNKERRIVNVQYLREHVNRCGDARLLFPAWQAAINRAYPKMPVTPGVAEFHQREPEVQLGFGGDELRPESLHVLNGGKTDVGLLDLRKGFPLFGLVDDLIKQRLQVNIA